LKKAKFQANEIIEGKKEIKSKIPEVQDITIHVEPFGNK
jgi:divalent metal cation (Fe/Co/Zn/Cd) transporter